ncbi:MAG: hypothetical protein ACRDAI_04190 [Candidatus Rhabdochlamydia sp.]
MTFHERTAMIEAVEQSQMQQLATLGSHFMDMLSIDGLDASYQSFRSKTTLGLEIGSLVAGGYGTIKGVIAFNRLVKAPIQISRLAKTERLTRTKIKSYLLNTESYNKNQIVSDLETIGLKIRGQSPDRRFMNFRDKHGNIRVKIHPADKVTDYDHLHIYDKLGNPLNKYLKVVERTSIEAHIPYGGN